MRKILKKLSVVLAVSLLVSQMPLSYTADVSAATGDTFEQDGCKFEIIDNNTAVKIISVSDTSVAEFAPPNVVSHDGFDYPVTEINLEEEHSFKDKTTLTSISFGDNMKTMSGTLFSGCTNLANVTLPKNLEKMADNAFTGCTALKSITIPKSLTEISGLYEYSPFRECKNLTEIKFEEGTETIANGLFHGCEFLTSFMFKLPDTLTEIKSYAFMGCSNLTSIELPASLQKIREEAFAESGLTSIKLPEGLQLMGTDAFHKSVSLKEVYIPTTLTEINGLWDDNGPFRECKALDTITFGTGIKQIPNSLFAGCDYMKSISIPDTVEKIGAYAFKNCSSLTEIKLPASLTDIDVLAFGGCSRLNAINLPEGLKNIGYSAFEGCESAKSLSIPASLEKVTGLWDEQTPFKDCKNIENISFADGTKTVVGYLFSGCDYIKSIDIPATVRTIGDGAFMGCSSLTKIQLPDDTDVIGSRAFKDCSRIEEVTLPKYLDTIGYSAFEGCTSLKRVRFQSTIQEITGLWDNEGPFHNLTGITDMTIDDGVKSIPNYQFANSGLKSLVIPSSVTKIDEKAFENMPADFIIYADENSAAAEFAKANGITCKPLSEAPKVSLPTVLCLPSTRKKQELTGTKEVTINGDENGGTVKLDATSNSTDEETKLTYVSIDPSIARVDTNGTVTAVTLGTTTITVSSGKTENFAPADDFTVQVTVTSGSGSGDNNNNSGNGGSGTTNKKKLPAKGKVVTVSGVKYKVTKSTSKTKTVTVSGIKNKKAKSATIAATVKISGYTYKVTAIAAKAFNGCTKLKAIKVKSTNIKSVGSKAFNKVPKSAKASVPKSKKAAYKKLFKKGGFKGKVK
ncbi:MAG: leucine-rich repeat protein [Ruminococcus flavefaciens]|nr:leucine-rich repeat protein [Ruminococcus flavefaciens]